MPEIRLDEKTHTYWLGDRRIRGTTEVIKACGFIYGADEKRLEEGRIIHKCGEFLVQGILDWGTVDPEIRGYVVSYDRLLERTGWVAELVERTLCDERLRFAGTMDLTLTDLILADLKSGDPANWHKIQLGAYWHLDGEKRDCFGIYLQEDGSIAKLKPYIGRQGWLDFLALLNYLNVRERY